MKPYDFPITRNPLLSRDDVASSLLDILNPCAEHLVEGNTGLFNFNGSTNYSDRVSLFEGWSRLLWA